MPNRESEMQGVVDSTKTAAILDEAVSATRKMSAESLGRLLVFVLAYVKVRDQNLYNEINDLISGRESDRG